MKNPRLTTWQIVWLICLSCFLFSCQNFVGEGELSPATEPTPVLYFPTPPIPDTIYHQALTGGVLTLIDECFYLTGETRTGEEYRTLILWPNGYSYQIVDDKVEILDWDDEVVAEVGQTLSMGGSTLTHKPVLEEINLNCFYDDVWNGTPEIKIEQ